MKMLKWVAIFLLFFIWYVPETQADIANDTVWWRDYEGRIKRIKFSGNGNCIYLQIYDDIKGGKILKIETLTGDTILTINPEPGEYSVGNFNASDDTTKIYVADGYRIKIYNTATGLIVDSLIIDQKRDSTHSPVGCYDLSVRKDDKKLAALCGWYVPSHYPDQEGYYRNNIHILIWIA